jgi:hypothetical protein
VREFKQLQSESKLLEVSQITREEQSYSIEPLLNDYAHKMAELGSVIPENLRKAQALVQPLPWKTFNWTEFLDFNPNSEAIYNEYINLEKECFACQK